MLGHVGQIGGGPGLGGSSLGSFGGAPKLGSSLGGGGLGTGLNPGVMGGIGGGAGTGLTVAGTTKPFTLKPPPAGKRKWEIYFKYYSCNVNKQNKLI